MTKTGSKGAVTLPRRPYVRGKYPHTREREELLARTTGYTWSACVAIAKRHGVRAVDLSDAEVIELVRAHLQPVARPAPTSVLDTLGRVRRAR